jgi:hypothetical protein
MFDSAQTVRFAKHGPTDRDEKICADNSGSNTQPACQRRTAADALAMNGPINNDANITRRTTCQVFHHVLYVRKPTFFSVRSSTSAFAFLIE